MRVSIIISNYNYGEWLGAAIDSALAQEHPDVEVIVVDDGSTDGSTDVIAAYGDRVTARFQANAGQGAACNAGFRQSTGDVVIFLDSDDVLLPGTAARHVAALAGHDGAVKSCGYMDVIDENGAPLDYRIPRCLPESGDYRAVTQQRGIELYQTSFTSGQAWTREFLKSVMPLPAGDSAGIDGYLSAVDRLFGPLVFIHEPVALYRRHARNRGPVRFRFDRNYMQRRLLNKRTRIAFVETWLTRLGLDYDEQALHRSTDWRLMLMQHVLHRMNGGEQPVPIRELLHAPFRNRLKNRYRALATSLALLAVRALPSPHDLAFARELLARSYRTKRR